MRLNKILFHIYRLSLVFHILTSEPDVADRQAEDTQRGTPKSAPCHPIPLRIEFETFKRKDLIWTVWSLNHEVARVEVSVHANVYLVTAQVPLLEKMRKNVKKKRQKKIENWKKIAKNNKNEKTMENW